MLTEAEQAHLYKYKISLETTKDRVNVNITAYSDDQNTARDEAIRKYKDILRRERV